MEALKEDAPGVHQEIESQLSTILDDPGSLSVIKKIVKEEFRRPVTTIDKVFVRKYATSKFLIVSLNDKSSCDLTDGEHEDGSKNYIVIGLKAARDKCPHIDCVGKHNIIKDFSQYPATVKTIVEKVLQTVHTSEDAVRKFVLEQKNTAFKDIDDEMAELGPLQKLPFCNRYQLTRNIFCPICRCKHHKPENCLLLDQAARMLTMGCRLDPDNFHPPGGLTLPQSVTNVIINQNNITINGNSDFTDVVLPSDYLEDVLPSFGLALELQTLFVNSFNGQQYDIARFAQAWWGNEFRFFHDKWHRFQNHIWEPLDGMPIIRHRLSTVLCDLYRTVEDHYRRHPELPRSKQKISTIERTITNLKTAGTKDAIMKEVKEIFQVENQGFGKEVNQADLLPFTNGVLDLTTYDFRPGRPEDKMSQTTHIEFRVFDTANETCKALQDFVRSILPSDEVRDFLLRVSSLCLSRQVKHQTFCILTGDFLLMVWSACH